MKNTKTKKLLIMAIVFILNIICITNYIYASTTSGINVNLLSTEDCGNLLTYKGITVIVHYVEYNDNQIAYPAYCLDKTKPGVETDDYDVLVQNSIKDVGLWRIITNGYPYKSCEELEVANKYEAFTATKQAVYCYIHGNNVNDYGAIGEAGERTLKALKNIVANANNSRETKISSTISIKKEGEKWDQDKMEENYVSKLYSINAGANIENYKIKITNENGETLEGIKITDENGKNKDTFLPSERFKVLIPINNLKEKQNIKLQVDAKIKTKPVLYGLSLLPEHQDYALTTASYEDGVGIISDECQKNETKITVVKKDQETGKPLENVEFELLNKDLEPIYTDLKTNEEGKIVIENLIPNLYYLNETKTIDGYELYTQLIKIELKLNQEATITVNNRKEEKPEIVTKTQTEKNVTNEIKKLPVTGM